MKCGWEMHTERQGVWVEEHMGHDRPYKIWMADLRKCSRCGIEVLAGFGANPVAEHFDEERYKKLQEKVRYHIYEEI